MQVPPLHTLPGAHVTVAHGSSRQWPPEHVWSVEHFTFAQALGAAQVRVQAVPAGHCASQAARSTHLPVLASQCLPAAQVTPAHGMAKQPATQAPSTQV
jgi:hypothetical protein